MRLRVLIDTFSRHRHLALGVFDASMWLIAAVVAMLMRLDFDVDRVQWPSTLLFAAIAAAVFTCFAWVSRLHDGRARLASLDEMTSLSLLSAVVGAAMLGVGALMSESSIPRSVPPVTALLALVLMACNRAGVRMVREQDGRRPRTEREPVVVIGACDAARQLIRSMRTEPESRWHPVGIVDEDQHNRYLRIEGVPVVGTCAALPALAAQWGARIAVVADPAAGPAFLQRMSSLGIAAGMTVKILPNVASVLTGGLRIRDVRDIALPDLLGRRQLDIDLKSSAEYLAGRRVLVIGAGGSIGAELCRQICLRSPAELIMLDRDESALHHVQLCIDRAALLDSPNLILADIRDTRRILDIFTARRPEIVFHAAALKHLPLLEQHPHEAVKTNVLGTLNVLDAAAAVSVLRFVNISTDKAADPSSVLGYSKRITERLTAARAAATGGAFLSVRFGNVLGSRGSVLNAFAAQIAAGGPVTVTHPDVTRYFMTVAEAVQLVIHAAAVGTSGETLVLDMGDPVRIDDVARSLIHSSGADIEIRYTGLRPGEKLNEVLLGQGENDCRPEHRLVSHVRVPILDADAARELITFTSAGMLVRRMRDVACGQTLRQDPVEPATIAGSRS